MSIYGAVFWLVQMLQMEVLREHGVCFLQDMTRSSRYGVLPDPSHLAESFEEPDSVTTICNPRHACAAKAAKHFKMIKSIIYQIFIFVSQLESSEEQEVDVETVEDNWAIDNEVSDVEIEQLPAKMQQYCEGLMIFHTRRITDGVKVSPGKDIIILLSSALLSSL